MSLIDRTDVTLTARTTLHRFHRDWDAVPSFAYGNETYLGPTLVSHRDQPWNLTTRNELGTHPFAKDVDKTLHGVPDDPAVVAATCRYGTRLNAAFRLGNVFATQFHPEKSGPTGLQLLGNFVRVCAAARDGVPA